MPIGEETLHGVLEAFGARELGGGQVCIARVAGLQARIVFRQWRWRRVVGTTPDQHLLVAEFGGSFSLVEALQRAVVAFVEPPRVLYRNPHPVHFLEYGPQGLDRAAQHRGIGDVEGKAFLFQQLPRGDRLGQAFFGEADIGPAGEAVFLVPGRFAVAKQNDLVHGESLNAEQ